jgi:phosphoglycolate phosphatase
MRQDSGEIKNYFIPLPALSASLPRTRLRKAKGILPDHFTTQTLAGSTLVFDLDGTLIDTAPDLVAALNHVLGVEGRRPLPIETVRMLVGHGAKVLIERGFAETGEPVDPDRLDLLVDRFVSYYAAHIAEDSRVFPGVREALERLEAAGARLAVCTNKHEVLALSVLQALDLTQPFSAIIGADTLPIRKPDPAVYHETVRRAGGHPDAFTVMIGDSPTDAATARAAQVPFIAVTFGYTPVPPAELGADVLIEHFDALDGALDQLLRRPPPAGR